MKFTWIIFKDPFWECTKLFESKLNNLIINHDFTVSVFNTSFFAYGLADSSVHLGVNHIVNINV